MKLTDGHSEGTRKYGQGHVFFHRLIHNGDRREALCRPDVWANWVELDMTNDPPPEYMCPACKLVDPDQDMATKATQQMIDKVSNLIIGEEGVVFIFSDREGVTIAANGIGEEFIPIVIKQALEVAKQ